MDDATLLARFEAAELPADAWTHRAHVKVAYLYLRRYPLTEATDRMRRGIQRLNAALGVEEGVGKGYNETVTQAFMRIVDVTMRAWQPMFPVETADAFCDTHPHLLSRTILRLFYSPEGRDPARERTEFVEPDLAPLPRWEGGGDRAHARTRPRARRPAPKQAVRDNRRSDCGFP